jgi:hypothetical protein
MKDRIYLALISEVYYARAIDITIDRKTAYGGGVSARPVSAEELRRLVDLGLAKATTRTTTTNGSTGGTNAPAAPKAEIVELSPGDNAFELAKKMRDLAMPEGVGNIGGSVKVLRVSTSNIGLRRTFERPVAVGVRGVLLKVNVNEPVELDPGNGRKWMKVESFGH